MRVRLATTMAFLLLSTCTLAQMSRFQGTWDSIDPKGTGLSRVVIDGKKIHLFGRCDSKPCDLGEVKAYPVISLKHGKVEQLRAVRRDMAQLTFVEVYATGTDDLTVTMRVQPQPPGQAPVLTMTGVFRRNTSPVPWPPPSAPAVSNRSENKYDRLSRGLIAVEKSAYQQHDITEA